ncbi:MAG: HlyD family efflux transporter periplasmic adaptor subunit [Alphaproteobacteria bacterium]|nr:HlyD family efflux transporter periplasmic adaptor subunit [Alphaproteobacteria bacterium]
MTRQRVLSTALGVVAVAALLGLAAWLSGDRAEQRAILGAQTLFTLSTPAPGLYQWTLSGGPEPEGPTVRWQDAVAVDRGDVVALHVAEGLTTGDRVEMGQRLAVLTSTRLQEELADLRAQIVALESRRALLTAGSRDEEVTEALRRVRVAEARQAEALASVDRLLKLDGQSVVSELQLQEARLRADVMQTELDLARAGVAVARSADRPEALAEIDARLAGLSARVDILEDLTERPIVSPISGVLALRTAPEVLQVMDIDALHARFPIEQAWRPQLSPGAKVTFTSAVTSAPVQGELVSISDAAHPLNGRQVFWACATLDNPGAGLRPGMSGTVSLEVSPARELLGRALAAVGP